MDITIATNYVVGIDSFRLVIFILIVHEVGRVNGNCLENVNYNAKYNVDFGF